MTRFDGGGREIGDGVVGDGVNWGILDGFVLDSDLRRFFGEEGSDYSGVGLIKAESNGGGEA